MSDLIFDSLVLDDFKSFSGHHEIVLDLEPGLYFVAGDNQDEPELGSNGAGKSTLFDAIIWCLFGDTIRDSRPADAVKSWNAKGSTTKVMLKFGRDKDVFLLTRQRNPNSIRYSGPGCTDHEIAQEAIPRILGLSEEAVRRTIILGQFGRMFLDMSPSEQTALFSEILSLEKWIGAANRSVEIGKDAGKKAEALKQTAARIAGNREALEATRKSTEAQRDKWEAEQKDKIGDMREAFKGLNSILAKLTAEKVAKPKDVSSDALDKAREALREYEKTVNKANRVVEDLQRQEKQLRDRLETLHQAKQDKTCPECKQVMPTGIVVGKIKEADSEIASIREQIVEKSKIATETNKKRKLLENEFTKAGSEYNQRNRGFGQAFDAYSKWKSKVDVAQRNLEAAGELLEEMDKATNPHETMLQRIGKQLRTIKVEEAEATKDLRGHEKQQAFGEYWSKVFKEIRLSLLDEACRELEVAATQHAERLGLIDWRIELHTERETKSGTVSLGFHALLYPAGSSKPIDFKSYSGGEVQRLQLATAFGLSEVLLARAGLTPNLLCLDEPTRGMSEQGVGCLLECLRDIAQQQQKAIWFVDHHSLGSGEFAGTIKVEKKNGRSKIYL
jgi:DNA repair exonuclease SbcCD ATPase subunit